VSEGGRRFCENCGTEIGQTANFCPNCGTAQHHDLEDPTGPLAPPAGPRRIGTVGSLLGVLGLGSTTVGRKQKLGLAGSIVLFIGVFAPIVSLPIVGNMNYFRNGQGDGVLVLFLALLSLVLTLRERFSWLWATGLLSLGLLFFTFVNLQARMSTARAEMQSDLAGNPFGGIANVAMQSVQIQWGWAVLVVGAVLIIAAAAVREDTASQDDVV
jgi:hypothetical protein